MSLPPTDTGSIIIFILLCKLDYFTRHSLASPPPCPSLASPPPCPVYTADYLNTPLQILRQFLRSCRFWSCNGSILIGVYQSLVRFPHPAKSFSSSTLCRLSGQYLLALTSICVTHLHVTTSFLHSYRFYKHFTLPSLVCISRKKWEIQRAMQVTNNHFHNHGYHV